MARTRIAKAFMDSPFNDFKNRGGVILCREFMARTRIAKAWSIAHPFNDTAKRHGQNLAHVLEDCPSVQRLYDKVWRLVA
jgi:hypothetical protein